MLVKFNRNKLSRAVSELGEKSLTISLDFENYTRDFQTVLVSRSIMEPSICILGAQKSQKKWEGILVHRFDCVDNRPSRFWKTAPPLALSLLKPSIENGVFFVERFESNPYFYEDYLDENPAVFYPMKRKMFFEFVVPEKYSLPIDAGSGWLQCSVCNEAWLPNHLDEMTECLKCNEVYISRVE